MALALCLSLLAFFHLAYDAQRTRTEPRLFLFCLFAGRNTKRASGPTALRPRPGAIKSDAHELGDASNCAGSARLALLAHPQRKASLALQHHF